MSRAWRLVGRTGGIAALIATATVIAACGSSTSGSGTVQGSPVPATSGATSGGNQGSGTGNQGSGGQGAGNGAANGAVNRPGASGKIAAVQSGSFQVQDSSSQTTVKYTSKTQISESSKATLADVKVGSCVTAIDAPVQTGTSGSSAAPTTQASVPNRTPGVGRSMPSKLTATTVAIDAAVDGKCTVAGFGGRGGPFPGGGQFPGGTRQRGSVSGGAVPSGAPAAPTNESAQPGQGGNGGGTNGSRGSGAGFAGFGGVVSGKVKSVSGSTFVVEVTEFVGRPGGTRTSGTSGTTSGSVSAPATTTASSTVTVTPSTTYTKTVIATSSSIKVGLCASAFGPADDTGAITAAQVRLSQATDGTCSTGFGGGFGGFGGFGGRNRSGGGSGSGSGSGGSGVPVTTHG
jgi:hypothetical protein